MLSLSLSGSSSKFNFFTESLGQGFELDDAPLCRVRWFRFYLDVSSFLRLWDNLTIYSDITGYHVDCILDKNLNCKMKNTGGEGKSRKKRTNNLR